MTHNRNRWRTERCWRGEGGRLAHDRPLDTDGEFLSVQAQNLDLKRSTRLRSSSKLQPKNPKTKKTTHTNTHTHSVCVREREGEEKEERTKEKSRINYTINRNTQIHYLFADHTFVGTESEKEFVQQSKKQRGKIVAYVWLSVNNTCPRCRNSPTRNFKVHSHAFINVHCVQFRHISKHGDHSLRNRRNKFIRR